jgi:hypothetical protein
MMTSILTAPSALAALVFTVLIVTALIEVLDAYHRQRR